MLKTHAGTTYYMLPAPADGPLPTLLLFAMGGGDTLVTEPYCDVGRLLTGRGWNVVSLDLPCHGDDAPADEVNALTCWATRIGNGEDIAAEFTARVNDVVAHIVDVGIADPQRIAVAGTSRGGFMAFHAAAANPTIRAVAAFAPVTDLIALSEFAGLDDNDLVKRLALKQRANAFVSKLTWITIGNSDERVGTDRVIEFSRSITSVRGDGPAQTTLLVLPAPGHTSLPEWHDWAAGWLHANVVV